MQEYSKMDAGIRASLEVGGTLEALCREGARRMLAEAMELEVEEYVNRFPVPGSPRRGGWQTSGGSIDNLKCEDVKM